MEGGRLAVSWLVSSTVLTKQHLEGRRKSLSPPWCCPAETQLLQLLVVLQLLAWRTEFEMLNSLYNPTSKCCIIPVIYNAHHTQFWESELWTSTTTNILQVQCKCHLISPDDISPRHALMITFITSVKLAQSLYSQPVAELELHLRASSQTHQHCFKLTI